MPGDHGEISVDEQNVADDDNKKTTSTRRRKKKDVDFEKGNQLIGRTSKGFIHRIRKKPRSPKRCTSPSHSGSRKGGCFCVMRPMASSSDDPNDESFTHEMLRVMLETNDFCSTECNPHR